MKKLLFLPLFTLMLCGCGGNYPSEESSIEESSLEPSVTSSVSSEEESSADTSISISVSESSEVSSEVSTESISTETTLPEGDVFGLMWCESFATANVRNSIVGHQIENAPDGRIQWIVEDVSFVKDNLFALSEIKKGSHWIVNFEANNGAEEYMDSDWEHNLWIVKKAFTATVYIKLSHGNDGVWFSFTD